MNRPKWLRKAEFLLLAGLCVAVLMLASGNVCHRSIRRVKESVLKQDLQTMRMAICYYTVSEARPPQSLQDLVDKTYLGEIPTNPFTGKKDWVPTFSNVVVGPGNTAFGIDYVYSSTTAQLRPTAKVRPASIDECYSSGVLALSQFGQVPIRDSTCPVIRLTGT